jgi:hypothetical protein
LLHSGLNPAWHFWLSTRFSCFLKMKSVENNFTDFREAVSLKKIFEIVKENILECSKQKNEFKPECLSWSYHYATGCFVAFLGDISILKSGWNMKKLFCCPALELFHCLPLWKTVLFVSSRAFLLSTPTFSLSTPVENMEKSYKMQQITFNVLWTRISTKQNCTLFLMYLHFYEIIFEPFIHWDCKSSLNSSGSLTLLHEWF